MANGNFGGGTGTNADPFVIEDVLDFKEIANNLTSSFILANDIDFLNQDFTPLGIFGGLLDGNGKTLSNIRVVRTTGLYAGIFTEIDNFVEGFEAGVINLRLGGSLEVNNGYLITGLLAGRVTGNVIIDGVNILSKVNYTGIPGNCAALGSLVGQIQSNANGNRAVTINNCFANGLELIDSVGNANIAVSYIGGLIGQHTSITTTNLSTITNCGNNGDVNLIKTFVTSASYIGGILGEHTADTEIYRCYNSGSILVDSGQYVGGIAGGTRTNERLTVEDSFNSGQVNNYAGNYVGGIVGGKDGGITVILRSYSSGNVRGSDYVGGIVGESVATVSYCYALMDKITRNAASAGTNFGRVFGSTGTGTSNYALDTMIFESL